MKTSIDTLKDIRALSSIKANDCQDAAVFVMTEMDAEENKYNNYLYLLQNDQIKLLTSGGEESEFIFEDDRTVLFPANRSKKEKEAAEAGIAASNYYRIKIDGGEARKAFTIPLSVKKIEKVENNKFIILASMLEKEAELYLKSADEKKKYAEKKKDESFALAAEEIPFHFNAAGFTAGQRSRLFLFDSGEKDAAKALEPLSDISYDVSNFCLSPDKKKVLYFGSKSRAKASYYETIYELDLSSKDVKQILDDKKLSIYDAFYWHDKIVILGSDMQNLGLNQNPHYYYYDDSSSQIKKLSQRALLYGNTVGTDISYGSSEQQFLSKDAIYFLETHWHRSLIMRMDASGKIVPFAQVQGSIDGFTFLQDELYVTALHDMKPSELYKVKALDKEAQEKFLRSNPQKDAPFIDLEASEIEKISNFNPDIESVPAERFLFDNEGINLEGFILMPEAAKTAEDKAYPAILDIHGGPKTVYGDVYFHEMQYWLSEGYIVIFTNPRGSDGRGDEFSDIRGDYGGKDFRDIMAFVDEVLHLYPQIDPERLSVTGGSYGGFMTNWIVGHTDRFKAAATQRSISNWLSFYGVSDIGYSFALDQNAAKLDNDDVFTKLWDHSPLKYVRNATTPTLFIHSVEDYRCPLEQGQQFYTGLVDQGVPARLVMFKKENHELSRSGKPKARFKRLSEITRWFDQYGKEKYD